MAGRLISGYPRCRRPQSKPLRVFFQRRGVLFAVGCVALHLLYYLYSGVSYFYVWAENQFTKRATTGPIAALKSAARSILLSVKS